MDETTGAPATPLVETSYTSSRVVALREADALARWLSRRPGWGRRLSSRLARVALGLVLVALGIALLTPVDVGATLVGAVGALAVVALLEVLAAPLLVRRQCRRLMLARLRPGAEVRARFSSRQVEVEAPAATHRVELASLRGGTWVGRDLVLEAPGSLWYVVPAELVDEQAGALLAAALGDRLTTLT